MPANWGRTVLKTMFVTFVTFGILLVLATVGEYLNDRTGRGSQEWWPFYALFLPGAIVTYKVVFAVPLLRIKLFLLRLFGHNKKLKIIPEIPNKWQVKNEG